MVETCLFKVREFEWNVRNTRSKIYFATINISCLPVEQFKKSENYYVSVS